MGLAFLTHPRSDFDAEQISISDLVKSHLTNGKSEDKKTDVVNAPIIVNYKNPEVERKNDWEVSVKSNYNFTYDAKVVSI